MDQTTPLPSLALSVRQPWAWAILHGGKTIENRSLGAIRSGGMVPGRICLHAAQGLRQDEYRWGVWRLARHGVRCPDPMDLPRGAIIGTVEVIEIITQSDSEWFGGEAGLVLADPRPLQDPIPCPGALGYFRWDPAPVDVSVPKWMRDWSAPNGDANTGDFFGDLDRSFATVPPKQFGRKR